VQTWHHYSLPTDGWEMDQLEIEGQQQFAFIHNQLGGPSPLREGDVLLAVEDQRTEEILLRAGLFQVQRPANWEVGHTVRYLVQREGRDLTLDVPLNQWSATTALGRIGFSIYAQVFSLIQLMIGIFVFVRRPRSQAAQLLLLYQVWYFVAVAISGSINEASLVALPDVFYVTSYWPTEFFCNFSIILFMMPLWVHLLLVFPVVKAPMRRFPRLAPATLYGSMLAFVGCALWWIRDEPIAASSAGEAIVLSGLLVLLSVGILSALHTLFTAQEPVRRAQIRWVAWGALVSVGYIAAAFGAILAGIPVERYFAVIPRFLFLAFPISLAVAILRYRLFDIDILINRTLVYGILSALLAGVYFSCVVLLQRVLYALASGGTDLAVVGSTLAIAALFQPLRRRVQATIDRRFYRQKYDATQTLLEFSQRLRDEVDLQALTGDLLVVVQDTVQPAQASLWLMEPQQHIRAETS
jgi:hypothetical protein